MVSSTKQLTCGVTYTVGGLKVRVIRFCYTVGEGRDRQHVYQVEGVYR